jgi:PAS domain S-box-containing protein
MVHPQDMRDEATKQIQAIIDGRAAISTVPLMTQEGEKIPVETKVVRGIWDGRSVYFGVTKDVTQQRLSEEMLSGAFEMNPLAMVISTLEEGKILKVNDAFVQITGYSREDAVCSTMSAFDLYADRSQRDYILSMLSESGKLKNIKFVLRRKDGSDMEGLLSVVRMEYAHVSCALSVLSELVECR